MTQKHACGCGDQHNHDHENHTKHTHDAGKCSCGHNHSHEQIAEQDSCCGAKADSNSCCCNEHDHESEDSDEDSHRHSHNHDHSGCGGDCGCGHEHSHDKPASKVGIILLIASAVLFAGALLIPNEIVKIILFGISVLLAGYDLFLNGFKENVLLLIAVVASFALGEYPEACIVTILFKLGSFLESSAISRSKKNMESLTQIRPDYAYIKDASGNIVSVDAKTISIGDEVYLRAGDRIAVDCVVIEGNSSIDSSALTGESVPVYVKQGDELMSGSVNLSGLLKCRATKSFATSTASQIIDLVYESSQKKGKTESFISRLAKVYTPIIMVLAVMIAVIPPLLNLGTFHDFIMRSLIFLVASCPCALVISIPLTFFASIGAVSKHGVLVKGSMYIEELSKINATAFDKTGTLTSGKLTVDEVVSTSDISVKELLSIATKMEQNSTHPIATAVVEYAKTNLTIDISKLDISNVSEMAGLGLSAMYNGIEVLCGGKNMLEQYQIDTKDITANVYICMNQKLVGYITVKEEIPTDSFTLISELKKVGIERVVMLTGDNEKSAKKVAEQCHIDEYYAGLLPKDKVDKVEMIKADGNRVLFVGDGINDAPVLTCANLGVSMGLGSEIANASSDVVLASNKLSSLPIAIKLSKRSMRVVYFNIIFALAVKIAVLVLGALGYASMWMAVFADIGVTILTVLNSVRLLKSK